jgi:hypothetical protein
MVEKKNVVAVCISYYSNCFWQRSASIMGFRLSNRATARIVKVINKKESFLKNCIDENRG